LRAGLRVGFWAMAELLNSTCGDLTDLNVGLRDGGSKAVNSR
jgi:hypothetical protein